MKLFNWIKTHKKEILAYGTLSLIAIGGVLFLRNSDDEMPILPIKPSDLDISPSAIDHTPAFVSTSSASQPFAEESIKVIDIEPFLRNLPKGNHPSAEKIASALEHGFLLDENQTWVDKHTRTYVA